MVRQGRSKRRKCNNEEEQKQVNQDQQMRPEVDVHQPIEIDESFQKYSITEEK